MKYKSGDRVRLINPESHWGPDFKKAVDDRLIITLSETYGVGAGWRMFGSWMSEDHLVKVSKPTIIII